MLPEVLLGRHCCAPSTNPDNYRPLVGDALIDEIGALAKDLPDILLQKSLKEGFGLVVSEGLWKGKPMVAGRAGGILMQFPNAYQGYLVDNVEDCAPRVMTLLDSRVGGIEAMRVGDCPI